MKREKLQRELNKTYTLKQLCRIFGVTPMTIHHWRKDKNLPVLVIPGDERDAIRVLHDDLVRWSRKYGKDPEFGRIHDGT